MIMTIVSLVIVALFILLFWPFLGGIIVLAFLAYLIDLLEHDKK